MADDKNIEQLLESQAALQESFEHEQGKFQAARAKYAKKKQALTDFNAKYGRMLKLVVVEAGKAAEAAEAAAAAEEAPAEEPEIIVVPVEPEEPAEGFPDAVDTSAEE